METEKKIRSEILLDEYDTFEWSFVKGLNVHHTYYQHDLLPWNYPHASLETYCNFCHQELHNKTKVPVLNKEGKIINYYMPCWKCHGPGWLPQFRHWQGGICFQCQGARYDELKQ